MVLGWIEEDGNWTEITGRIPFSIASAGINDCHQLQVSDVRVVFLLGKRSKVLSCVALFAYFSFIHQFFEICLIYLNLIIK
jgi:hypothetical protein